MANSTATFQPKVPIATIRSEFPDAKVMSTYCLCKNSIL